MPTITIVGAGPGLGHSIAKVFGEHGFRVALVARSQGQLDRLAEELSQLGIEAAGFAADIMEPTSLVDAMARVKKRFGAIDVLEFSPAPHNPVSGVTTIGPLDVTADNVQPQIDFYVKGAITAVREVLPDMLDAGAGTLLFTTGGSSIVPNSMMGNVGIAAAGLRNWVLNLHQVLAESGIHVAHIAISAWIGQMGPESEPDAIAKVYWEMYTTRKEAERHYQVSSMPLVIEASPIISP